MEPWRRSKFTEGSCGPSLVAVPQPGTLPVGVTCKNVPTALFRVANDVGLNAVDDSAAGLNTQPPLFGDATELVSHTYASPRPSQSSSKTPSQFEPGETQAACASSTFL